MLKKGDESAAVQPPFSSSPLKSHAVNLLDVVGTVDLHKQMWMTGPAVIRIYLSFASLFRYPGS